MVFEHEYDRESQRLRINCMNSVYGTTIEDSDMLMATVIDKLREIKDATTVVLSEAREYEYGFNDVRMLREISDVIERVQREHIISARNLFVSGADSLIQEKFKFLKNFFIDLRYDPIEAYKNLKREYRISKTRMERETGQAEKALYNNYVNVTLSHLTTLLENTKLIQSAIPLLTEHKDRSLYRKMFHPTVRANFMYTRYMSLPPENAELLEKYSVGQTSVEIYKTPLSTRKLYHIIPPEFHLDEMEYSILDEARRYIGRHEPREIELAEPERIRENLYRIGIDMIHDIARNHGVELSEEKITELAGILTRYTAGIGILEILLKDENVQDIMINSPIGITPVYIFHGTHEQCETNIVPTLEDAESWATRFRLQSGRPLDEANPVLDTEVNVPGGRARVTSITRTLSPDGLGFALRRHRDSPWTYPLFIKNRFMDPFTAGLMWFLVDGSRTLLIAGTRSSGKTSFLGSTLVQIMPKLRIISVEDTLELPIEQLRTLGYNVERLKSRSVITNIETELAAEDALRTALRLGDSCLIVGEVRSKEALALYEAMRIGALANVVAGTIHGESVYGVYDRVVNDLGVPPTSFKATDIVAIANMLKTPDGMKSFRRLVEVTEVRKHWSHDPLAEGGFVNLLEYSAKEDMLKPTKTLLTGESVILNEIASRVREWRGNWDAVWDNINLRANVLKSIVDISNKDPNALEAPRMIKSNSMFHIISAEVREELGALDPPTILERWTKWLKESAAR